MFFIKNTESYNNTLPSVLTFLSLQEARSYWQVKSVRNFSERSCFNSYVRPAVYQVTTFIKLPKGGCTCGGSPLFSLFLNNLRPLSKILPTICKLVRPYLNKIFFLRFQPFKSHLVLFDCNCLLVLCKFIISC